MKAFKLPYLTLAISLIALAVSSAASASDTLTDFIRLQRSGVSEDVIVAWAARQPPLEPTKEAMDALIQAKVSGRIAQALLLGNTRPGFVPPKAAAKPTAEPVQQKQVQADDNIVIQPASNDSVAPDTAVVVDGGVTYYPDVYWPYVWSSYWNFGTYGYWWPHGYYGWRSHYRWHDGNGDWHYGNQNGHEGMSGYHYGIGQSNNIRHEGSTALQQSHNQVAHSYVPAQSNAVTPHQSYSSGAYSHGNASGYSGGHSYSGGLGGGHSFGGGHGFGGGGHGGGRR